MEDSGQSICVRLLKRIQDVHQTHHLTRMFPACGEATTDVLGLLEMREEMTPSLAQLLKFFY